MSLRHIQVEHTLEGRSNLKALSLKFSILPKTDFKTVVFWDFYSVCFYWLTLTFRRNIISPSLGLKELCLSSNCNNNLLWTASSQTVHVLGAYLTKKTKLLEVSLEPIFEH
jgi:hypothetical protein